MGSSLTTSERIGGLISFLGMITFDRAYVVLIAPWTGEYVTQFENISRCNVPSNVLGIESYATGEEIMGLFLSLTEHIGVRNDILRIEHRVLHVYAWTRTCH